MNRGQNQEQAPWEAAGAQDDGQASDAEFDEDAYLRGRNDFRRTSLDTDLNKCGQSATARYNLLQFIFVMLSNFISPQCEKENKLARQNNKQKSGLS